MIKKLICASALIFSTSAMAGTISFNEILFSGCGGYFPPVQTNLTFDTKDLSDINSKLGDEITDVFQRKYPEKKCRFESITGIDLELYGDKKVYFKSDFDGTYKNRTMNELVNGRDRMLRVKMVPVTKQIKSAASAEN